MKFYTSYFYQLRFFPPNLIPISTAKWDPKWFKLGFDKRGVMNGLRAPVLVLPDNWNNVEIECGKNCGKVPFECNFMKAYDNYLHTLDFKDVYSRAIDLGQRVIAAAGRTDQDFDIVLLVHEPASCKCAERPILQKWFRENGVEIKEWTKKN